ncbi:MAG: hypothetical protein V3R64_03025 [Sphingomonadales bacterium]
MKLLKFTILFALVGFATPALSQSFGDMTATELIRSLRARIIDIKETESILSQNTTAASNNRAEATTMRSSDASLETRSNTYDRDVASHNSQVNSYNVQCLGSKLPEDQYTGCLSLKQNLDLQKSGLDAEGDRLEDEHETYNRRVRDLNSREATRAEAAAQLLSRYERLDGDIRQIQLRLYDIAVSRDQNGFAEEIRQCTKRDSLDAVYICMSNAFSG